LTLHSHFRIIITISDVETASCTCRRHSPGPDLSGRWIRTHFRRQPFGSVVVSRYDAIPQKNGKTEFVFEQPTTQPCVHALFPHSGYQTCWYLSRHTEQRINY
jgi:hypothetical protein